MANYRIKVERLNDKVELSEALERGVEVDGFAILAEDDDRVMQWVHYISIMMMAQAIDGEEAFITAAALSRMITTPKAEKGQINE